MERLTSTPRQRKESIPAYLELPEYEPGSRHSWDHFGRDDQLGMANWLDDEATRRGIEAVQTSQSFSLNWRMDLPNPPFFRRTPSRHRLFDLAESVHPGTDDVYDNFYSQASSQWDALSHIATPSGDYFGGRKVAEVHDPSNPQLGMGNIGAGGIATRFILLDLARMVEEQGGSIRPDQRQEFTADDLDACLQSTGVDPEPGDALLLRFGWLGWYESLNLEERQALAARSAAFEFEAPGLSQQESTAEWLWDRGFAAVASDTPGVEALPSPSFADIGGFLHYRLIPLLGCTIGEFFVLDQLADAAASLEAPAGLLVAAPFNNPAGSGSLANAVAVI
jgi:kynurenine formamidase